MEWILCYTACDECETVGENFELTTTFVQLRLCLECIFKLNGLCVGMLILHNYSKISPEMAEIINKLETYKADVRKELAEAKENEDEEI